MKKISFLLTAAALGTVLTLTSCSKKKDWKCECTINGVTTTNATYMDTKESDADDNCDMIDEELDKTAAADCGLKEIE